MKNGKIVSSDQTRKKIQEALKNKNNLSIPDEIIAPKKIHELRKNITIVNKNKDMLHHNQKKVVHRIERPHNNIVRRPTTQYLTNVKSEITRLSLPERGSFNAGLVDIGDKYLLVYRPDEIELIACFLTYDYVVVPNSFYKFKLLYVADPRLIITPDKKVLMSYSRYTFNNNEENIEGNIIMDLNKSKYDIFQDPTISISPRSIGRQKNWMPFIHDEKLYFIAHVCPHVIYGVDWTGEKESFIAHIVNWRHNWFLNEQLRGNTNAIMMEDGNYLCTFHTAMMKESHNFYDNGAYIFEGKPPFKPLYCGHRTYLRAEAAKEKHFRKMGIIVCTFPIGMTTKDEKLIISYGDNDSCVKIMETTIDEMNKTMSKVGY
jgi:predicted GH43/DUF377 family glycosyl hydrolase